MLSQVPVRKERGSILIEAAITLPVIIILIAGMVDYGWAIKQRLIAVEAMRTAARTGSSATSVIDQNTFHTPDRKNIRNTALHVAIDYWENNVGPGIAEFIETGENLTQAKWKKLDGTKELTFSAKTERFNEIFPPNQLSRSGHSVNYIYEPNFLHVTVSGEFNCLFCLVPMPTNIYESASSDIYTTNTSLGGGL
jgi:hypothetical protein